MKKSIKKIMLLLTIAGLGLVSCAKEGCTDGDAENFCSDCKKDDGSCTYTGSYVIWVPTGSLSTGESVNVYMDGVFQGNIGVEFTSAPSCGATGALTVNKNLGKNKTLSIPTIYKAVYNGIEDTDANNWLIRNSNFQANTCVNYELQ